MNLGDFHLTDGTDMYFASNAADVYEFMEDFVFGETIYRTAEPIAVENIEMPKTYKAWNGGTETIIGEGDAMNAHAHPAITQEYFAKVGG